METFKIKKNYNLEFLLDPLQRGRLVKIHGLKQLKKMVTLLVTRKYFI